MFYVQKIDGFVSAKRVMDMEGFDEYMTCGIGDLCSTLVISAVCGESIYKVGNQAIRIRITDDRGRQGMSLFLTSVADFVEIARSELVNMEYAEKEFFTYFIKDYEMNGVVMPFMNML